MPFLMEVINLHFHRIVDMSFPSGKLSHAPLMLKRMMYLKVQESKSY